MKGEIKANQIGETVCRLKLTGLDAGQLLVALAHILKTAEASRLATQPGAFIAVDPVGLHALGKLCDVVGRTALGQRKKAGRKSIQTEWLRVAHDYYLARVKIRAAGSTKSTRAQGYEAVKAMHPWIKRVAADTFDRHMRTHRDSALGTRGDSAGTIYLAEDVPEDAIQKVRDEDLTKHT